MVKILEDYTLEDVPEVVKSEMITALNTEGTDFNNFLIKSLEMLTETIEELEKGNSIVASSVIY